MIEQARCRHRCPVRGRFRVNITREHSILSEFYQLRRNAIKDIAAYLGFLAGFIGAAPFGWGLLAAELEAGAFARGLWYFFGIVTTAGIFAGIAGLGLGHVMGLGWEQVHRHRRRGALSRAVSLPSAALPDVVAGAFPDSAPHGDVPRLQLVIPGNASLPHLVGRRLTSVRFLSQNIEMDFSGVRVTIRGGPSITCGPQRYRFPDTGSRDALCDLIGATVERMRVTASDRLEIGFDIGCELVTARSGTAVA